MNRRRFALAMLFLGSPLVACRDDRICGEAIGYSKDVPECKNVKFCPDSPIDFVATEELGTEWTFSARSFTAEVPDSTTYDAIRVEMDADFVFGQTPPDELPEHVDRVTLQTTIVVDSVRFVVGAVVNEEEDPDFIVSSDGKSLRFEGETSNHAVRRWDTIYSDHPDCDAGDVVGCRCLYDPAGLVTRYEISGPIVE